MRPAPGRLGARGRRLGSAEVVPQSWIVAVGDELLSGHTLDGNSSWLAATLSRGPYPCSRIVVVPDRVDAIAQELLEAARGPARRIFCCGGLGPTPDDRTMAGVARMLGVGLVVSPEALHRIRERVASRFAQGRSPSPEPNPGTLKMALVPDGAELLANPVGGAPPLAIRLGASTLDRWLFVLPGVPLELRSVVEQEVLPRFFAARRGRRHYQELRFSGLPESIFFPALTELEAHHPRASFGSYPQEGGQLVIRVSAPSAQLLARAVSDLRRLAPAGSSS
ncbi:MAG: competence/damage-inducible protein A [Candidatus Dormibacteria bacterium]